MCKDSSSVTSALDKPVEEMLSRLLVIDASSELMHLMRNGEVLSARLTSKQSSFSCNKPIVFLQCTCCS